ncbi:methyltransferase [Sulfurihydrogenibium sp.]|uniref:tRNA1(Val) (adenine(37)-N6)-methyltransferase n=1 Tax=Sulfurihydrogenibium sp. TaxID=2053621 RepID=UPI002626FCBD|nr:methyltransferase [Sulfurihydrogenibium sp.]
MNDDEDLSPFIRGKVYVVQKKEGYRFNIDSLFLADFVNIKSSGKLIDLGTGSGIILILLSLKYKNLQFYGLEVQPELYHLAEKNFVINDVKVDLKLVDVKDVKSIYPHQFFDYVVVNPPYFKSGEYKNIQEKIARSEVLATLEDFIKASWYLLKNKGKIFMIVPVERLSETIQLLKNYKLQPKRYRFIHPSVDEKATHFMFEAIKQAKEGGEVVESPLVVYENPKEKKYANYVWNMLENYPEHRQWRI